MARSKETTTNTYIKMKYEIGYTFPLRLLGFIENVETSDMMSEEEKQYLLMVGKQCLCQLLEQSKHDAEIYAYCKNCADIIARYVEDYKIPQS